MGRIHTLYYLQVLRSQEDAKEEKEKARKEAKANSNDPKAKENLLNHRGPSNGNIVENRRRAAALAEYLEEFQ